MLKKPDGRSVSLTEISEYPTMAMHIQKEITPFLQGATLTLEETEIDEASYFWAKKMAQGIAKEMFG